MEAIYRRGQATAADVYEDLPDAASYNAVRGVLRILEEKGHLEHVREGRHYVYRPVHPRGEVGRSMLDQVSRTFFGGSAERVMSALLEGDALSPEELDRLQRLIARARRRRERA